MIALYPERKPCESGPGRRKLPAEGVPETVYVFCIQERLCQSSQKQSVFTVIVAPCKHLVFFFRDSIGRLQSGEGQGQVNEGFQPAVTEGRGKDVKGPALFVSCLKNPERQIQYFLILLHSHRLWRL